MPHEFVAGRDPYDRSVVRRAARVCGAYFAWRWPVVFGNLSGAIANHPLAYHLVAGRPRNDRVVRTVMAEPADAELLLRYGFSLPTDCPDAELNARMDRLADWLASPAALRRAAAILDGRTVDEREQIKSRMGEDRA